MTPGDNTNAGRFALTVVVPTRNRAVLLRDTLGAVLAQSTGEVPCELIVVDDGSTDETPEIVTQARPTSGWTIRYDRHPPS
jgi:glycosyltransferase involved in cell wall biosynthesis